MRLIFPVCLLLFIGYCFGTILFPYGEFYIVDEVKGKLTFGCPYVTALSRMAFSFDYENQTYYAYDDDKNLFFILQIESTGNCTVLNSFPLVVDPRLFPQYVFFYDFIFDSPNLYTFLAAGNPDDNPVYLGTINVQNGLVSDFINISIKSNFEKFRWMPGCASFNPDNHTCSIINAGWKHPSFSFWNVNLRTGEVWRSDYLKLNYITQIAYDRKNKRTIGLAYSEWNKTGCHSVLGSWDINTGLFTQLEDGCVVDPRTSPYSGWSPLITPVISHTKEQIFFLFDANGDWPPNYLFTFSSLNGTELHLVEMESAAFSLTYTAGFYLEGPVPKE